MYTVRNTVPCWEDCRFKGRWASAPSSAAVLTAQPSDRPDQTRGRNPGLSWMCLRTRGAPDSSPMPLWPGVAGHDQSRSQFSAGSPRSPGARWWTLVTRVLSTLSLWGREVLRFTSVLFLLALKVLSACPRRQRPPLSVNAASHWPRTLARCSWPPSCRWRLVFPLYLPCVASSERLQPEDTWHSPLVTSSLPPLMGCVLCDLGPLFCLCVPVPPSLLAPLCCGLGDYLSSVFLSLLPSWLFNACTECFCLSCLCSVFLDTDLALCLNRELKCRFRSPASDLAA